LGTYTAELTIPANTPEAKPVEKDLTLEGAILDKIHFLIPAGHHALARSAILYGIEQLFPYEKGTWLRGEDESFPVRLNWPLPELKTTITLKGWNKDTAYPHTFYLRLEVAEKVEEARPWRIVADFVAILKRLMGL